MTDIVKKQVTIDVFFVIIMSGFFWYLFYFSRREGKSGLIRDTLILLLSFSIVLLKYVSLKYEVYLSSLYYFREYLFLVVVLLASMNSLDDFDLKSVILSAISLVLVFSPAVFSPYIFSIIIFWSIGISLCFVSLLLLGAGVFFNIFGVISYFLGRFKYVYVFLSVTLLLNGVIFDDTTSLLVFFLSVMGSIYYREIENENAMLKV